MTKKELIKNIAEKTELPQHAVSSVIENMVAQIRSLLSQGDRITLSSFGAFSTKNKAQREGRNPQTGESIIIPARRAIKFTAAKKLKGAVNDS